MADLRKLFSTSEFLIPMPHLTDKASCPTPTSAMKTRKREPTINEYTRSRTCHLHSTIFLSNRRPWHTSQYILQKASFSILVEKWDHPYSSTLCWLRCRLGFSLLQSSILSIRGARSSRGHAIRTPMPVDLVNQESNILSIL